MNNRRAIINTEKETRGFFWFMTLILVGLAVWEIYFLPSLRQPKLFIPFCMLMAMHILLHWALIKLPEKPAWLLGYMLTQGLIMLALILIAKDIGIALGLSLALIGEAIGVYGITWRGWIAAGFYLILSLGSYISLAGTGEIKIWLLAVLPMIIFVVLYVEMYSRQANANIHAGHLVEELESANKKLKDYADQVEDLTIANERQRMARELHDTLSQDLAGLILQLEAAEANLTSGQVEKARNILQQTMQTARTTLSNARVVIDDLRHPQNNECHAAMLKIIDGFSKNSGLLCTQKIDLPDFIDESICNVMLPVITEAFANIARHARATKADMQAEVLGSEIMLKISDNGIGFDPSTVPNTGHYGLIGMKERLNMVRGNLLIESDSGSGTLLTIRIPLP
jgi:NarL family two-component system sensor histidine kinase YdfH